MLPAPARSAPGETMQGQKSSARCGPAKSTARHRSAGTGMRAQTQGPYDVLAWGLLEIDPDAECR